MLSIIRFLRGYLIISFIGSCGEKILNICALNNLHIWDMRCIKGVITAKIDVNSFKKLRVLKRGIKANIKILKKCGLPFTVNKYKLRSGFVLGIIMFFVILKIMTLFVWDITVTGNESIDKKDIIKNLKSMDIYVGKSISEIDTKTKAQELVLNDGRIAWASLNIEGCLLDVNLTESTKGVENKSPSNIVSLKEGNITKIDATGGNVLVKVGQPVFKGDILISGIIENLSGTVFVKSSGNVYAKTKESFSASGKFSQKKKVYSNKTETVKVIEFFGFKIPFKIGELGKIKVINKKDYSKKFFGSETPIKTYLLTYKKVKYKDVKFTKEQLIKQLEEKINNETVKGDFLSFTETNKSVSENADGLTLEITYDCEEKISNEEIIKTSFIN